METFTITKKWLQEFKTSAGGYNKKQLNAVGIEWPPTKGWQRGILGKKITEENRLMFEDYSLFDSAIERKIKGRL